MVHFFLIFSSNLQSDLVLILIVVVVVDVGVAVGIGRI